MKVTIFDFVSYRSYLKNFIAAQPNAGRGWGSKMAIHLGCHTSFVSHVLSGLAELSLEQAFGLTSLLGLNEEEGDFFILLVSYERAGNHDLKRFFLNKINEVKNKRKVVVERIGKSNQISLQDQVVYYSSWQYAAVHVLTSIPKFQDGYSLSSILKMSPTRAKDILQALQKMGLVKEVKDKWIRTEKQLHLPASSPMIKKHHQNWRLKAVDSVDDAKSNDLQYSSVVAMARTDVEKVQEIMMKAIEEIRAVVRESPEEDIYCYMMDFFSPL
jgi:uncharacterized protein (TIGR02147 family)